MKREPKIDWDEVTVWTLRVGIVLALICVGMAIASLFDW